MQADLELILSNAHGIASAQKVLPNSPAIKQNDGGVAMCAAACIGYSAIALTQNYQSAEAYRRSLLSDSASESIFAACAIAGLSRSQCAAIKIANDQVDANERLQWFNGLSQEALATLEVNN